MENCARAMTNWVLVSDFVWFCKLCAQHLDLIWGTEKGRNRWIIENTFSGLYVANGCSLFASCLTDTLYHSAGNLFPVNERATRTIRNLYVENERVISNLLLTSTWNGFLTEIFKKNLFSLVQLVYAKLLWERKLGRRKL